MRRRSKISTNLGARLENVALRRLDLDGDLDLELFVANVLVVDRRGLEKSALLGEVVLHLLLDPLDALQALGEIGVKLGFR